MGDSPTPPEPTSTPWPPMLPPPSPPRSPLCLLYATLPPPRMWLTQGELFTLSTRGRLILRLMPIITTEMLDIITDTDMGITDTDIAMDTAGHTADTTDIPMDTTDGRPSF